jgi:uncharacterized membrane protein YeaQ/YmgE (transglycosylase-associated protein family)
VYPAFAVEPSLFGAWESGDSAAEAAALLPFAIIFSMNLWHVLLLLLIAGVCGFAATKLMGAKRINVVLMVILGFIGAALGQWLAGAFHFPLFLPLAIGAQTFPLVWALIGSIAIIGIVSAIQQH